MQSTLYQAHKLQLSHSKKKILFISLNNPFGPHNKYLQENG